MALGASFVAIIVVCCIVGVGVVGAIAALAATPSIASEFKRTKSRASRHETSESKPSARSRRQRHSHLEPKSPTESVDTTPLLRNYIIVNDPQNQRSNQTLHCVIIASYGDTLPTGAVAKKASKFLPGVSEDVKNVQKLITNSINKDIHSVSQAFYREQMCLEGCKEDIRQHMHNVMLTYQDTTHGLLIWYTGHGKKDTGDWPLKDGFLRFQDIYDLYKKEFSGRPLYVITDCCYSGAWVTDCAKLLDHGCRWNEVWPSSKA